jgi:very-short-patch-repair endonuclease
MRGWLRRIHRGVYAVGSDSLTDEGRWMAAILATGHGASLSHQSAAELWRLRRRRGRGKTDITIAPGSGRRPGREIVVHRKSNLLEEECTLHRRLPVTTPARTLLDLATTVPRRQLERALDEADRLRLCTEDDVGRMIGAHRGQPGTGALRALLSEHRAGSTATRNDLEERFLALCRAHHLPQPAVNMPLLDYIVDFLWAEARLVVEVDGRQSHDTRRAFQADRDRDGRLAVAGFRVVRFTWRDLTRRPAVVADRVRRLLTVA